MGDETQRNGGSFEGENFGKKNPEARKTVDGEPEDTRYPRDVTKWANVVFRSGERGGGTTGRGNGSGRKNRKQKVQNGNSRCPIFRLE